VVPEEALRPSRIALHAHLRESAVWLAREAPRSVVARLLRIDWVTVGRMIERVLAEAEGAGPDRLDGLARIGIDKVSYRRGQPVW
jgi:hypothetical protein